MRLPKRLVGSIIAACLSHFILFGELSLKPAIKDYLHHYHQNASIKAEALCHPRPPLPNEPSLLSGNITPEIEASAAYLFMVSILGWITFWVPLDFQHACSRVLRRRKARQMPNGIAPRM